MKNVSTKIAYMVIGSILTLIGYHFGNVDNNSAEAQKDDTIADEIRCRRLVLVGDDNTPRIVLETKPDGNGSIAIRNKDGRLSLVLDSRAIDGVETGNMLVIAEGGKVTGAIGSDMYGGYMAVYTQNGSADRSLAQISTTEDGDGIIFTKDKKNQVVTLIGGEKDRISTETYRDQRFFFDNDMLSSGPKSRTATAYAGPIKLADNLIPKESPAKICRKGDKLPPFNFSNDVKHSKGIITYVEGNVRLFNKVYNGPLIQFSKKGDWIELTNGTRYTCRTENCMINMETYTILNGEIDVSYKDRK